MPALEQSIDRSFEDIFEAIDNWLDGSRSGAKDREYKIRRTSLGHVCILFERGSAVAMAHARGSDQAIERALEKVGAL